MGIDLAWGTRAPTGLAAVAEDGALIGSATVRTDDEVVAWVDGLGARPVVVAIDAPLVVRNATGMRACEKAVSRSFGAFGAAAVAFERGPRTVTHLFNAMRPFGHRDPGLAGAALTRDDVVVQVILDGHHLAPLTAQLVWRVAARHR